MSHVPPPAVARAAKQGLDLRASLAPSRRGGTAVGIARARDLAHRRPVSDSTLRRMVSYFARHEVDAKGRGWGVDSKGWQAWLLWGGDAGRQWAAEVLSKHNPRKTQRVILADYEDLGHAACDLPWLVTSPTGERLEYHATRVQACARANVLGGNVYQVVERQLRPVGHKGLK